MTETNYFIAIDGDSVGRHIEQLIMSSKLHELYEYSYTINQYIEKLRLFSENLGGKIYLQGGDNLLVELSEYQLFIEKMILTRSETKASFSVGIAKRSVEAYLGLKYAKSAGKGLVILVENSNGSLHFKHIT